jgi:1,4-dihydroxy-2-naphthoate octaprenyltransferase
VFLNAISAPQLRSYHKIVRINKLTAALFGYLLLALVATFVLQEPRLKAALIVLMAALAAKTVIAEMQDRQRAKEAASAQTDPPE